MLKTKIPMRRKVPVLSGQKVVLMDAGELNPGLAEFLHLEPKAKKEGVECKDHGAAGYNSPSNTTLAEAETKKQIPSGSNPTSPNTSQHQVSQLQEIAKEPKTSDTSPRADPVERGHFITELQLTQIKELAVEQEQVSKILENLPLRMKKILADILQKSAKSGKDARLGKWPQSRREITGIIMAVIVALFIAVAVCLFTFWYNQKPVETPVPTWWEYCTSIFMRFVSFY